MKADRIMQGVLMLKSFFTLLASEKNLRCWWFLNVVVMCREVSELSRAAQKTLLY